MGVVEKWRRKKVRRCSGVNGVVGRGIFIDFGLCFLCVNLT